MGGKNVNHNLRFPKIWYIPTIAFFVLLLQLFFRCKNELFAIYEKAKIKYDIVVCTYLKCATNVVLQY